MNQIKWRRLNTFSFELLRADFMRTVWNEDVVKPNSIGSSEIIFKISNYDRGRSGYMLEMLKFSNKDSIQAVFWERFCDLADTIYTFTVSYNNDHWHKFPEFEDDVDEKTQEKAFKKIDEKKYDDMSALEMNIIALSKEVSKSQKEQDIVCYDRVIKFINSKDSYLNTKWIDIDDWNKAQSLLLQQLELFFYAVGPDPFLFSYLDEMLPEQTAQHFDWRINPILRDIYLGFLTRNPFLIDMDKKILDDTQLLDLLFRNPDKPFPGALELKQFNGRDVLHIENFDKLLENKYEVSFVFFPDCSYKEIENMHKDGTVRKNYTETD